MPLIKSISGIRGTIGEIEGEDLTTNDIVKFTSSFVTILVKNNKINNRKIIVGRDARISGPMIEKIVIDTLVDFGIDVICLGLSTTPTVEIAVTESNDPRSYRINSDKLLATGFKPKKTVEHAVKEIIEGYRSGILKDEDQFYNLKWMQRTGVVVE